jgi:hypothetical protein
MSLRSSVVLVASLSILAGLAACGGGSNGTTGNGTITGTTTTNSELNGTYTFSLVGTDASGNFFAMTGTVAANGSGGITGGAVDYSDPGGGVQGAALSIMGGSYAVGADGRGTATLIVSNLGKVGVDFVLSSTSHGLITRFDSNGSGSGTLDLQATTTQSQFAGSYAFSLNGLDGHLSPASLSGAFTLDASGNATGVQDVNDALSLAANQPLTGTVMVGSGSAPGTATLNGPFGTLTFDVYAVDQTHLKLIEADSVAVLTGDVFTQQNATIPAGPAVFTFGGLDSGENSLATGGLLTFNSDGTVSGGTEDVNDGGLISQFSFTGTYTPVAGVTGQRSVLSLVGTPGFTFVIYPSSGGLLMQEMDGSALTTGTALAQTATTFSTSGGYGLNLSSFNLSAGLEVDDIASMTPTGGNITGTVDENGEGQTQPNLSLTGTYSATGGGRGTMTFSGASFNNADYYVADSSTALMIETDTGQIGVGSFAAQSGISNSAAVLLHAAMARPKAGFHPALNGKASK